MHLNWLGFVNPFGAPLGAVGGSTFAPRAGAPGFPAGEPGALVNRMLHAPPHLGDAGARIGQMVFGGRGGGGGSDVAGGDLTGLFPNPTIAPNAVTNAKLADMAQSTIKGRAALAGTGDPTDLTVAQVITLLGLNYTPYHYVHLRDQKAASTDGGSSSAGVQTRTLNTEVADLGGFCSLSSNQFTLIAGTYVIRASAPCLGGNRHMIYLYNATAGAVVLAGTSEYAEKSTWTVGNRSFITGRFTVAASQALEIRHEIGNAHATNGLGAYGSATQVAVYTEVELWREVG